MSGPDRSVDRDALAVSLMALHAALDGWAATVLAVADAHPDDPERAVEEPALGGSEDVFDAAFDDFHAAAGRVLGLGDDDLDDETDLAAGDPDEAVGVQLYATVVGAGQGDPVVLVDAAGEQVVAALEAAGYDVPEWSVSIVPVQGLDDATDDDAAADSAADEDDA